MPQLLLSESEIQHGTHAQRRALRESQRSRRQSRIANLLSRRLNIIWHPPQFEVARIQIVNDVRGFGIIVARLTDRANVNEILLSFLMSSFLAPIFLLNRSE